MEPPQFYIPAPGIVARPGFTSPRQPPPTSQVTQFDQFGRPVFAGRPGTGFTQGNPGFSVNSVSRENEQGPVTESDSAGTGNADDIVVLEHPDAVGPGEAWKFSSTSFRML